MVNCQRPIRNVRFSQKLTLKNQDMFLDRMADIIFAKNEKKKFRPSQIPEGEYGNFEKTFFQITEYSSYSLIGFSMLITNMWSQLKINSNLME